MTTWKTVVEPYPLFVAQQTMQTQVILPKARSTDARRRHQARDPSADLDDEVIEAALSMKVQRSHAPSAKAALHPS